MKDAAFSAASKYCPGFIKKRESRVLRKHFKKNYYINASKDDIQNKQEAEVQYKILSSIMRRRGKEFDLSPHDWEMELSSLRLAL